MRDKFYVVGKAIPVWEGQLAVRNKHKQEQMKG
jgi:hypothetical protein